MKSKHLKKVVVSLIDGEKFDRLTKLFAAVAVEDKIQLVELFFLNIYRSGGFKAKIALKEAEQLINTLFDAYRSLKVQWL